MEESRFRRRPAPLAPRGRRMPVRINGKPLEPLQVNEWLSYLLEGQEEGNERLTRIEWTLEQILASQEKQEKQAKVDREENRAEFRRIDNMFLRGLLWGIGLTTGALGGVLALAAPRLLGGGV